MEVNWGQLDITPVCDQVLRLSPCPQGALITIKLIELLSTPHQSRPAPEVRDERVFHLHLEMSNGCLATRPTTRKHLKVLRAVNPFFNV